MNRWRFYIRLLLHYNWNGPCVGVMLKLAGHPFGFVFRVPQWFVTLHSKVYR